LGAITFSFYPFSIVVNVSNAPRGGAEVLFEHQKQYRPSLESGLPSTLKCSITGRSTLDMKAKKKKPKLFYILSYISELIIKI
jgi:hypothetical protein